VVDLQLLDHKNCDKPQMALLKRAVRALKSHVGGMVGAHSVGVPV
jgi:hypothetical protein